MKITKYRVRAGLNQSELAEKIGVKAAYISEIENHKRIPSVGVLIHLARVLETAFCDLLDIECIKCENCKKI